MFPSSSMLHVSSWINDGDTVNLYDVDGTLVDSLSYPARDSWYGNSYVPLDNGTIWKVRPPTPSYAQDESFAVAQNMIGCFGISDGGFVESMLLKGRVVTMNNEADVINGVEFWSVMVKLRLFGAGQHSTER